jgi:hypothetical protein
MWSDMLDSVEAFLGLSIIISLDSSIFGSSRLMIIDRKTIPNCNLSAASWLALSRICPEVSQNSVIPPGECINALTSVRSRLTMIARFFKYTSSESATKVLKDKRLRWSSPDSFNDPFGLKNPLEQETKLDYLRRQARQDGYYSRELPHL